MGGCRSVILTKWAITKVAEWCYSLSDCGNFWINKNCINYSIHTSLEPSAYAWQSPSSDTCTSERSGTVCRTPRSSRALCWRPGSTPRGAGRGCGALGSGTDWRSGCTGCRMVVCGCGWGMKTVLRFERMSLRRIFSIGTPLVYCCTRGRKFDYHPGQIICSLSGCDLSLIN